MEISIIVPTRNIEKYIARSLESIKAQTFKDWECVIVDDASDDTTPQICRSFAEDDERFRIVSLSEASGVAIARNTGIREAKGRFVVFVDSDDWVEENYLQTLHDLITSHDVDMAQCGFFIEKKRHTYEVSGVDATTILNREEALFELLHNGKVHSALWSKIFKREKISPSMPRHKTYEDMYAMTEWIDNMDKIILDPGLIYHYRQRKSSIINSNFAQNKIDYLNACKFRGDFISNLFPEKFNDEQKNAFLIKHAVNTAKMIARHEKYQSKRRKCILEISDFIKPLPLKPHETLSKKTVKRARMIKKRPLYFLFTLNLLEKFNVRSKAKKDDMFE